MEQRRFHALDGLRGICAASVLFYHTFRHAPLALFTHGYLSVDIFFALSGFVLAYAFGERLEAGMRPVEFMRARIRRLGPVIWFAAIFSVAGYFVTAWLGGPTVPPAAALLAGVQSAVLLPMLGAAHTDAFPLNGPIWSLFAEFWVNVGFALIASRLRLSILTAIIAAGWLFVILHALGAGTTDIGAAQSTILYSIARAIPSFGCGVLLFRLWKSGALAKLPSVHPMLVFLVWVAISLAPDLGPAFDLVQTIIVAPLIIALLARCAAAVPGWTLWLGRISYPLYATHVVIIYAGQRLGILHGWGLILLPAIALVLADALARWVEPRTAENRMTRIVPQNAAA